MKWERLRLVLASSGLLLLFELMPPKTKRQARWLWANKPGLMKKWKKKGKHKPTGGRKKKRG